MSTPVKERADATRDLLRAMRVVVRCDCRCSCHAGLCNREVSLDTLDCEAGCRSAHILASNCDLDETRPKAGHL